MRVVGEKSNSSSPALWIAFWLLVLVVGWMLTGGEQFGLLLMGAMGVGFAAFCIWLTVRIFNRRERWAKRTAAGLLIGLVMYPLSFPILVGPIGKTGPVSIGKGEPVGAGSGD